MVSLVALSRTWLRDGRGNRLEVPTRFPYTNSMKNKIYLISQNVNNTWDTYDSAVVIAPDEATARKINPSASFDSDEVLFMTEKEWAYKYNGWCSNENQVSVRYIGEASEAQVVGVVCASYNAG